MRFTLSDGRELVLDDCGDDVAVKLYTEDETLIEETMWGKDELAFLLFD